MYHSIEYIHHKKTGPHNLISLTRWIIKWIIMSKNEGRKYIFNWQRMMETSFFKSSNCWGSMNLLKITLKKKHKRVMATLTLSGKILRMATDNSCCINSDNHETSGQPIWDHWQIQGSWYLKSILVGLSDFIDNEKNLFSLLLTLCDMLGANTYAYLVLSDATILVYPCQTNLDDISNHHLSCLLC